MSETCRLIPDVLEDNHGYHIECYKRFTANMDRLVDPSDEQPPGPSRPKRNSTDKLIFNPDCIFCNLMTPKKIKKHKSWTTEGLCMFKREGWHTICDIAENANDDKLLCSIRGVDLFPVEAKFHHSC